MGAWGLLHRRSVAKPIRSHNRQQQDTFRSRLRRSLRIEQFEERTLLSIGAWTPIGPAPINYADSQVENVAPWDSEDAYLNQVVGSITAVAAHPTNANTLYVGTTNGGIWRTNNATSDNPTWTQLTDDAESLSIGALAFDPTDPAGQTLIAGAGRFSEYYRAGGLLSGLLRTTNGGETWTQIDGDGVLDGKNCISIAVRGGTILVAVDNAQSGLYGDVGIFRSDDGGETFTLISNGDGGTTGLPGGITYDLAADPTDTNVFYTTVVGASDFGGENGIYKSSNEGLTWIKVSSSEDVDVHLNTDGANTTHRVQMNVGPEGQLYVGILNQMTGSFTLDQLAAVFRTGDGGTTWTEMAVPQMAIDDVEEPLQFDRVMVAAGDPLGTLPSGQGAVHFSIVADPTNAHIVYIGCDTQPVVGEDSPFGAEQFTGLLLRGNALQLDGEQWVHLTHSIIPDSTGGTASGSAPHADSRDMVFDVAGRLIEVDDGGIYVRTSPRNNTGDWFSLNGNLQIAEIHDIAYDSVSNVAIAGAQDVGVLRQTENGSLVWREVTGGDGGDVVVDEASLADLNQSYRYSSGAYLEDFQRRTVDADNSVIDTVLPELLVLGTGDLTFAQVDGGQFRTPIAVNAADPSRIVIGGATSVFESLDRGETLRNLGAAANANAIVSGGYLNGVANPDVLWVASDAGVFLRDTAAGNLAQIIDGAVLDIAVDPTDWRQAFIITSTSIWRISVANGTVTNVTGDYTTAAGLRTVEYFDSGDSGAIVVGGVQGVYYSELGSLGNWSPLGEGLPNAPVYDIEYDAQDNILVVGTLGRGAWQFEDPRTEIFGELALISVSTNVTTYQVTESPLIDVAPTELTLHFNDTTIDSDTLAGIQIIRAGANGTFYDPVTNPYDIDDVVIEPGYISIGENPNEVLIRFAETLPDDIYRVTIVGQGSDDVHYYYGPDGKLALPFSNTAGMTVGFGEITPDEGGSYWDGQNFSWTFDLNLGPQVTGVVPQPITRASDGTLDQARNQIEIYFSEAMDPASAETEAYYSLISTQDTANTSDDVIINPTQVDYDAAAKKITLTFGADSNGDPAIDLTQLVADPAKNATGAFRLRIGDEYRPIVAEELTGVVDDLFTDVGSTFDEAADLGTLVNSSDDLAGQSWLISGYVSPIYYDAQWPGGRNTPGNRDLPEGATDVWPESHTMSWDEGDTGPYGDIPTYYYNFQTVYGTIQEAPALNLITEVQKQRSREIFSLISQYSGVQFVETADQGMTIVTGDLRVFDAYIEVGPGAPAGMASGDPEDGLVVVNSYYDWGDSEYGSAFMQVMMHEIMHPLGAMHSYELPAFEIMGSSETIDTIGTDQEVIFPGNNDVAVLQYLYRNDSIDTDFYKFEIESEGDLSAETIAQRMQNSSLLDTYLVLYDDQFQIVASNDDYFDDDSFIGVHLEAGTYYIGVSSTGNSQYGPDGDGGTTEGAYQLRLDFQPQVDQQLTDARGTALDGDADGVPGGHFDFWFNVQRASVATVSNHTLIVDKATTATAVTDWVETNANTAACNLPSGHGFSSGKFEILWNGGKRYSVDGTIMGDALALHGGNGDDFPASGNTTVVVTDGTLAHPFQNISSALDVADPGDIVRVVGNNFANDNQGHGIQAVPGSLLVDGDTFTISDATRTFTFEFDNNNTFTQDNIRIAFNTTDRAAAIAAKFAAAINSTSWIPEGLSETAPTRYSEGLYARAIVDGTIVNVDGPTVVIDLGSTELKLTIQDNLAYEIGTDPLGYTLSDGNKLEVPQGVSLMIDAGTILKLRGANVSVGSSAVAVDRSLGSLQVLGTPGNSVYFTSYLDERMGEDTYANTTVPTIGNWGGLVFQNNYDYDEQEVDPNRIVLEQEGIFLNYVNYADIRYGGGKVAVNGIQDVYNPIHMVEARPTVAFSTIRYSADAAMSADPNSLLETTFHDGFGESPFAADYDRVGPDLHGNKLVANSLNALFLRVTTAAASALQQLDVSARFDDVDVVLAIPENLIITGDAGGAVAVEGTCPLTADGRNQLVVPEIREFNEETLEYDQVNPFVDRQYFFISDGQNTVRFEFDLIGNGVATGSTRIALTLDPQDPADVAVIIADAVNDAFNDPTLDSDISANADGDRVVLDGTNVDVRGLTGTQARMAGRLSIDPGAIVKLAGTRIEVGIGAQFIAEGADGYEIIFTSLEDDTYGAGGTFDAASNGQAQTPGPGNWGGFYFNPTSRGSIDQARVLYAGGSVAIEGGFGYFAPVDVRQATVRITNTLFQNNTAHTAENRNGRGEIEEPAVIHVLFSQPVIAGNTFIDNLAPVVSIDVNSLNYLNVADWGRATREAGAFDQYGDNQGPLVRENRMSGNSINGMIVRGGNLTTEGVWDDTDIVHVLYDEIVVSNLCTYGGLRLQSSADQSLVVKLSGSDAGLTATGRPLEIHDRIGGTIQVLGTSSRPVVFTDLADDTVGAGLTPDNRTVLDTDNTLDSTGSTDGAWRSIQLQEYSNDRNVAILNEAEPATIADADANANPGTAEWIGQLADENKGGDESLRMGFEVHGTIALDRPDDIDVYSFQGYAGSEVWIQLDRTTFALDTVVELLDADGNVLARSDNWRDEAEDPSLLFGSALTLEGDDWGYEDVYSVNPRDAGMRVALPGPEGLQRTYYIRVSSAAPSAPDAHQTSGAYQLQVRLRKVYEHPGSTIRYADIRYATDGIEVLGLPGHSPLGSDIYETEAPDNPTAVSNDTFNVAQSLGNLLQSDQNAITVGGFLDDYQDVDWYKLDLDYGDTIQRISDFTTEGSVYPVTFDLDYADGLVRPDTTLWIFDETGTLILQGTDSGIVDDQPDPTAGTNLDDLSRGSVGARDPFIGPVYLLEGHTYYVAVTSTGATASAVTDDPMMRWEPINSIQRIAEDNIGSHNASGIGNSPAFELNPEPVPFHLGDVTFYVLTDGNVLTADPWTGVVETTYGTLPDAYPNANRYTYGDLVMLSDGRLHTITRGSGALAIDQNDAAGRLRQLSTGDASQVVSDVDDGLITYRYSTNPANPPPALEVAGDNSPLGEAGGVHMEAMVYRPGTETTPAAWYVVGNAANGFDEVAYQSNLLYLLLEDGTAIDHPDVANDGTARLPTNIIPIAQLAPGPVIAAVDATHASDAAQDILDGTRFTVTDKDGNVATFELDCGPDVDMSTGALVVRDGMTFTIGTGAGQGTFEFDGGPVMILGPDVAGSRLDGQTFTITDENGESVTFEFDVDGTLNDTDNTAVTINVNDSADAVADAAVNTINDLTDGVVKAARGESTLDEARVSLINDSPTVLPAGDGLLDVEGRYGLEDPASGNIVIGFEETWDDPLFRSILTADPLFYPALFGDQIASVVETNLPDIDVSAADRTARNDRITFGDATVYDFSGMDTVWTHQAGFDHGGGAPLSEAGSQVPVAVDQVVLFGAGDTARQISQKISAAINQARVLLAPFIVSATPEGPNVNLTYASLTDLPTVDAPLTTFGSGPGGKITGMAFLDDVLYAVSDTGGFFEVVNYDEPSFKTWPDISDLDDDGNLIDDHEPNEIQPIPNPNAAHLRFIECVESDQNPGNEIEFVGLTLGPQTVEEARYAEMFFAVSRTGDLYALSLDGDSVVKEDIFVDAQTSVTVPGITAVSGLCFSTLDYNMWHVTDNRAEDDGHDVNQTYDLSRVGPPPEDREELPEGGPSYYFGMEGAYNYNAPGGAYGSLVTQTFSLENYSKADVPTLYFEYFLDTGGPEGFDTARVFASADGVNWQVLGATLDNPDGNLLDTDGQWHQTRLAPPEDPWQIDGDETVYFYSLADFAGESEVRLRFDFTTAGEMHVGDTGNELDTTGAYLQALAGDLLEDGDQFTVDGMLFEFDMGVALRLPNVAGDAIADGETFTVMGRDPGGTLVPLQTFEFDRDGTVAVGSEAISIEDEETTTEVAYRVAEIVNGLGLTNSFGESIVADVYENRVMLNRAEGLEQSADPKIEAVGDGFRSDALAATPIEITSMMTAEVVAQVIGATFDAVFAGGSPSFRVQDSIIRMIHHPVDYDVDETTGLFYAGPLPYANSLPGDLPGDNDDGFNSIARGQDNAHEGFYLDNIMIGFAERGEMATQVQVNTDFVFTEEAPEKVISIGYYQLQIRSASEYATWVPDDLYPMVLDRSFDINNRFDKSYTLTVPSANDIPHKAAFIVSGGVSPVTFQFLDENVPTGNPDYEPIYFSINQDGAEVAARIVEAINAAAAAGLFNVTATMNETSNQIDLFGAAKITDVKDVLATGTTYMITDDWGGTWSDAEKIPPDDPDGEPPGLGDDFMCWAASASNILAWTEWGLVEDMRNADEMFDYFEAHWTDEGSGQDVAWEWWFSGVNIISDQDAAEVDAPGGAFFRSEDVQNYFRTESDDAQVMVAIDEFLHDGYGCGLGVYDDDDVAHAITVWGFDYDESDPDYYVGVYVTDSDDDKSLANAPDQLRHYEIQRDVEDARWYLQDYFGEDTTYISEVYGLARRFIGDTGVAARKYTENGDLNQVYDQGQVILENNEITYSSGTGILVSAADRDGDVAMPKPGPTAPLAIINGAHQVPGIVIQNNIVAYSGNIGIQVSGDVPAAGESIGSVPIARIVNNTVYEGNTGIAVINNASATILNNVVANTQTGINVSSNSSTTVVGTTAYSGNRTNLTGVSETFAIEIPVGEPLFVDAAKGNFYPAAGSRIIDSSLDSLQDRANMVTVKNPLGLPLSPILAPSTDVLGQLRMDDPSVSPPSGFGESTYKDRGAIDRVDFDGPNAFLIDPPDNDVAGIDRNPMPADVAVAVVGNQTFPEFIIRLQGDGAGIADYTVVAETVQVMRDEEELIEGRDYYFTYEGTSNRIILSSAGGAWAPGSTYTIYLSDGIRDQANNLIQPNHPDDTTSFVIELIGYDFGDAPMIDTYLPDGARHIVDPEVYLGEWIDSEATPKVDTAATADASDNGVDFADGDYVISQAGETKTITVTASTSGVLDAWIDWNQNSVWDAGEKLALRDGVGTPVTGILAGETELTFDVPAGLADSGDFDAYVRFRFSTTGLLSDGTAMLPTGEALDGEVEDYRIRVISTPTDWGDAPDPDYPTLEDNSGASHTISTDVLCLGGAVSLDPLPKPNPTATGDDDDDGVDFSGVSLTPGQDSDVSFTVTNETGLEAYLSAWIDFNRDGDWSDAGEMITGDFLANEGPNTLTISVPDVAVDGDTFARFRLSTEQGLSFTGPAADGEVEDYRVTILPKPGEIHGTKWNDLDGNGINDVGEVGLEGWTIYLDANNSQQLDAGERLTTTASDGSYVFDEVVPGEYIVREVQQSGWQQYGTEKYNVSVDAGEIVSGIDFFNQDIAPPEVVSIVRGDADPTNADSVTFIATFSEPVTGVDADDFEWAASEGLTDAAITGVTGADDVYTVTVSTGLGDGTLRLDLFDDDSIQDLAGFQLGGLGVDNGDYSNGEEYTVDKTQPMVVSIERDGESPTNAETVIFVVTFGEAVTGVDIDDFVLVPDGLTDATIKVTGADDVYAVTVTVGDGDGTLQLNLVDNDTIVDLAGNDLVGTEGDDGGLTGPVYEIDRTAPQVASIVLAGANPTSDSIVYYTVTFSEEVTGVNASDFALATTGMVGTKINEVSSSGDVYTVTVLSGAGNLGTVRLDLIDNDSILDLAGNALVGEEDDNGDLEGEFYTIDRIGPTGLFLSNDRVVEHALANTPVGALSSTGPNPGAYTYKLVSEEGVANDNVSFRVVGGLLRTNAVFDFDTKGTYNIRLRTTDSAGYWRDENFTITVVAEADTASIGDLVWNDDGDGLQEAGEAGVAGATVEILCSPSGVVGSDDDYSYRQVVTDADGDYGFDLLLSDLDYYLMFRSPSGYTFTSEKVGSDEAINSDADANGVTALFTLAAGEANNDLDAGLVGSAAAYDFAIRAGAAGDDVGQSVATDLEGNAYVAGVFRGTVDFDPGVGVHNLSSAGGSDAFVAKYSSNGTLIWVRAIGGEGDDAATSVSAGSGDVVCLSGSFSQTADFLSGPGVYNLTAAGSRDAFVMKLDSAGGLVWVRGMGGANEEVANDVAVGIDGSVYSTGFFVTSIAGTEVDFDPGEGVHYLASIGQKDVFISKLDYDGNFVWAKRVGGTGWSQGSSNGMGIAVAADDSVYTTGSFEGVADFDPGPNQFALTCAGDTDMFLSKLDDDGAFAWARRVGGANAEYGADVAVASDGSVYLTGGFQGVVDFDPGAETYNLDSAGYRRLFASKLTSSGNFVWADGFGGTGWDFAGDIALDDAGDVYVTGGFYGIADFDPGAWTYNLTSTGQKDAFVLKLNSGGGFVWAQRTGGTGEDSGNGIAVHSATGAIYTTGYFHGAVDFDPSAAVYQLHSAGGRDAFLAKYIPPAAAPLTVTIEQGAAQTDPTLTLPIVFRVVFDASVSDFTTTDVTLGDLDGDAPGAYASAVNPVGTAGTTYNVLVAGMTGSGDVTASIAAGMAHNTLGTPNQVSTSADNTVAYTYIAPAGPVISDVIVEEAQLDGDYILDSGDPLIISWAVTGPNGVATQSLKIDGQTVSEIYGPYEVYYEVYYYGTFGPVDAGNHDYTIEVTDTNGLTDTCNGTFDVTAATVVGPVISQVVVDEAQLGGDGILDSSDELVISWAVTGPNGVATQSLKIDGQTASPIYGPNAAGDCYGVFGPVDAGSHDYTIEVTDTNGVTKTHDGTFDVTAATVAGPVISQVVVAEANTGSDLDGTLESSDKLVVTWAVTGPADVASQSLKIDGQDATAIYGPYGVNYAGVFGPVATGNRDYTIEVTDTNGVTKTHDGTFQVLAALTVEALAPPVGSATSLTVTDINSIVTEAAYRLEEAFGPRAATALAGVSVEVTDLSGKLLGAATDGKILIDDDAAGYGWFVDPTPDEDEEFAQLTSDVLSVRSGNAAEGRADLLTTVMHEMGHVLGFEHADEGLMAETLPLGVRRLPSETNNAIDQVFASLDDDDDDADDWDWL